MRRATAAGWDAGREREVHSDLSRHARQPSHRAPRAHLAPIEALCADHLPGALSTLDVRASSAVGPATEKFPKSKPNMESEPQTASESTAHAAYAPLSAGHGDVLGLHVHLEVHRLVALVASGREAA